MTPIDNVFGTAHQRWTEAQRQVIEYERTIFHADHQFTAQEMLALQALRATAAQRLDELIVQIELELGRLYQRGSAALAAEQPAPG